MNPYWAVWELSSRQTAQRHMSGGYPEVALSSRRARFAQLEYNLLSD
jgi:hypothetical protein